MPRSAEDDERFIRRALALAAKGARRVRPNPRVGAVVVSPDGIIVGEGWHRRLGGPHAEVAAVDAAGDAARGATLYLTLEPWKDASLHRAGDRCGGAARCLRA